MNANRRHRPWLANLAIGFALTLIGVVSAATACRFAAHSLEPGNGPEATAAVAPEPPSRQLAETYGKLPLQFEANRGQTDPRVRFLARGNGYTLFLTSTEAVLVLRQGRPEPRIPSPRSPLLSWRRPGALDGIESRAEHLR
jgi:hypothetical protein